MTTRTGPTTREIREWAEENYKRLGFPRPGERGRLSTEAIQAYNREHGTNYVNAVVDVNFEDILEDAEKFLRAIPALQGLMSLADKMADPNQDFYHPDVAREMKRIVNESMSK